MTNKRLQKIERDSLFREPANAPAEIVVDAVAPKDGQLCSVQVGRQLASKEE